MRMLAGEGRLRRLARLRTDDGATRAIGCDCTAWLLDLAPPDEHLRDSLARAVSQVPQRPDRLEALSALCVGDWSDADRARVL